ncbi:hypothetical protein QQX98_008301 [Neonectria punicea]|uniref:NAD-dependent epimerase/dehydratase domain-containing protein n=1 Tax=Neonectria punicea TaxID=979145 RepID=A0ABR1GVI1_9HYPO
MTDELVLITGVSGHIGFRVLAETLKAGYRTRTVVRNASHVEKIKSAASVKPYLSQLDFAIIPDLGTNHAFDAHVDGVSYIIHVAAPQFTSTDVPITSNPPLQRTLSLPPPKEAVGPVAYVISKVLSAQLVLDYVATTKPGYSVVNILPGTTIGRSELASDSKELMSGSNIVSLAPLIGISLPPVHSVVSHIDDVAIAHVKALDIDATPSTIRSILPIVNTVANPDAFTWDDIVNIVKSKFPAAIKGNVLPLGGTVPKNKTLVDTNEDEKILGIKFKTYEEAVIDLAGQFLQLAQTAGK